MHDAKINTKTPAPLRTHLRNGVHNFQQEPQSVLNAAPILIIPRVDAVFEELVNQVPVSRVNLDPMEAARDAVRGALAERVYKTCDVLLWDLTRRLWLQLLEGGGVIDGGTVRDGHRGRRPWRAACTRCQRCLARADTMSLDSLVHRKGAAQSCGILLVRCTTSHDVARKRQERHCAE